ncbi:tetratricopeptide repeat protein [Streptomyces sp. NPDC048332]|uniref:tetratricopeptide repeat protein n=1 Tax=Streptomyces sp. NPDC048332 TaxID=3154619 RepID=UPI0034343637
MDVHLLQEPAAGRYRMHDLLRQAARAEDAAADPALAVARLADYYLSGMLAVTEVVELVVTPVPVTVSQQPPALPDLSHDRALDWLDAEWANITATSSLAVELRIGRAAVGLGQLAFVISLGRRGGMAHVCRGLEASMPAAEALGERRVLASHRYLLGAALLRVGRLEEAVPELETARALMAGEDETVGQVLAIEQLAEVRLYAADAEGAMELLREAIRLVPPGEAAVRVYTGVRLGRALVLLGEHAEARTLVTDLLGTARELDRQKQRMCLDVLGRAALGLGDARTALDLAEQAVAISRESRHPVFEAISRTDAAVALRHLGSVEEATAVHAGAMRMLEAAGEPHRMMRSLLPYAEACLATGDREAAARHFKEALEIATGHGVAYLASAAGAGLARIA